MKSFGIRIYLLLFTVLLQTQAEQFKRVCYFTNWSSVRANVQSRFQLSDIDPSLCTHILYAFAGIDVTSRRLTRTQADDDNLSLTNKQGRYFEFTDLKRTNPGLKTLLSVGGENSALTFSGIVTSADTIREFAKNCRIYLYDRGFDGIDIDWEFPGSQNKDHFTDLLKALHEEFANFSRSGNPRYLLTIAAAPGKDQIDNSYNVSEISKYVDFINVMAYDYFGSWSRITGFNSPLYTTASPTSFAYTLSQNWTMHRYLELGAPRDKLVMGLNAAAVGFVLADANSHGVGAQVSSGIGAGPVLATPGRRSYPELCKTINTTGVQKIWDEGSHQTYAYSGTDWYGYETAKSLKEKVQYANDMKFSGVMFWSMDLDDFNGTSCGHGPYPLLSAIRDEAKRFEKKTSGTTTDNSGYSANISYNVLFISIAVTIIQSYLSMRS